jgi:hypothetical protein
MNYKLLPIFVLLFCGCDITPTQFGCDIDQEFTSVTPIVEEAESAFISAEKKIFVVIDDTVGPIPDPDANKCPCKGTGKITHGDGHTTQCPYHG